MEIRAVSPEEADGVMELIRGRMAWMDDRGLRQWNMGGYLEYYNREYFRRLAAEGCLFAAVEEGRMTGALALLERDDRWTDDGEALYVHHLVAVPEAPGTGGRLLEWAEEHARAGGRRFLRLDSQRDNPALARYYEARGYRAAGEFRSGGYLGCRREKRLV